MLARSLARAEYFSQTSGDKPVEKQDQWIQYVSTQGRSDGAVLLQLASLNPLVADGNVTEAKAAVIAMKDIAALKPYSYTLGGDLALSSGDPNEALQLYTVCQKRFMFRTCTLRKAEAELRNDDREAAKKTIESFGKSPSVADSLVYERALKQLRRD